MKPKSKPGNPKKTHSKEWWDKADRAVEKALLKSAMGYWQIEEKAVMDRNGKVKVVKVRRYYRPNMLTAAFWLRNRLGKRTGRKK